MDSSASFLLDFISFFDNYICNNKLFFFSCDEKKFQTFDLRLSLYALIFNHIQLIIVLILYFISPKLSWWNNGFKSVIQNIEHRLYLIEQPIANILGVIILSLGWSLHKKSSQSSKKFLRIGVFYLIGFISISSKFSW